MRYTSATGTKIESSAGASAAAPVIDAQISVEFSRWGAFLFDAASVRQIQLAGRLEIMAKILELYEQERWKKEWYVVESIYAADSATVIVALDRAAGVTLAAQADVPLAARTRERSAMKIGITLFATDRSMSPVELAQEAEARGFYSLYIPEHTHIPTSR